MENNGTNGWVIILAVIFFPILLVVVIPLFILGILGEMKNSKPH